jgi:uncharacterized protein (TIGR00369 family)
MSASVTTARPLSELTALFNDHARIARTLGAVLSFDESRHAVLSMPYNAEMSQAGGDTHGGVTTILLDTVMWFQAVSRRATGYWPLTSDLNVHFLRSAGKSALTARAKVIKGGANADVMEGTVHDAEGRLVAHAVGTFTMPPSTTRATRTVSATANASKL